MRPSPNARRMRRALIVASTALTVVPLLSGPPARSDDAPKADSAMVKLLKGGKVPPERQGTVIEMIGRRGSAADLSYLFDRALSPEGFGPALRLKALDALAEASRTRNARPDTGTEKLGSLIDPKGAAADPAVRLAAVRLAAAWKVEALQAPLAAIAADAKAPEAARAAAIDALAALGGKAGRSGIEALAARGQAPAVRGMAVAALSRLDVEAAARAAADVLRDAPADFDPAPLLAAFLNRKGGSDVLAKALSDAKLPADPAKLALRSVYALGHSDAALVAALTKAAGIDADVRPLDPKAMEAMLAEVAARGDAARGEAVFRRVDVNCTKCHALSGAGGGVGPDLSAVGASSPVDYLVNSIMVPDQAVKEEFRTLIVQTADGQVYQGIVADRDGQRLVLREATGDTRVIPAAEVEDSKEGGSLMPKGLVNFMTRTEFVDLLRFLSELGKPGPYAIRATPTVQRWRVLKGEPEGSTGSEPPKADPARWAPVYAKVAGALPLAEAVALAGGPVVYLQGEVDASRAGKVEVKVNAPEGLTAWLDDRPAPAFAGDAAALDLPAGRHTLTLRVDTAKRGGKDLRVEVLRPSGSTAEYAVVGGR